MRYLTILIVLFLCVGCDKTRLAIAGIDPSTIIDNYEPVTPLLVGKSTATVVSMMRLSNRIADDTAQAMIKELCVMDKDYRKYWMNRQYLLHGIDYSRACDHLN